MRRRGVRISSLKWVVYPEPKPKPFQYPLTGPYRGNGYLLASFCSSTGAIIRTSIPVTSYYDLRVQVHHLFTYVRGCAFEKWTEANILDAELNDIAMWLDIYRKKSDCGMGVGQVEEDIHLGYFLCDFDTYDKDEAWAQFDAKWDEVGWCMGYI